MTDRVDIIIPVLNEEEILTQYAQYYKDLKTQARVIFVDGGSSDQTVEIARAFGDVISAPVGRGLQKNHGARKAQSEYLLFMHVDTFLPENALQDIERVLKEGVVGGSLTMSIQDRGFIFRIYETAVNMRARWFKVIDGDLGMFVRQDVFHQLGGFDLLPIMEDLLFGKKMRGRGAIRIISTPIYVSSRKWHHKGFLRTFFEYTYAYVQLWMGQIKERPVSEQVYEIKPQKK